MKQKYLTKIIPIRLSEELYEKCKKTAGVYNMPNSSFIRELIVKGLSGPSPVRRRMSRKGKSAL